jgi:hypothetical protein
MSRKLPKYLSWASRFSEGALEWQEMAKHAAGFARARAFIGLPAAATVEAQEYAARWSHNARENYALYVRERDES